MKITDLKCTVLGANPVIRITTDEGISGLGEVEASKHYLKPHIMFYKDFIVGEDPTDVERVMMRIRKGGSFKPWGSSVSAIEWRFGTSPARQQAFRSTSCWEGKFATRFGSIMVLSGIQWTEIPRKPTLRIWKR